MQTIKNAVDKHRQLILDTERYIWQNPETGYKEFKTSKYMEDTFESLGYDLVRAEGITGFCADIDTGKEGPTLLILGELDSIICPAHKDADPVTGAVHSCGHNAQCAALVGVAAALKEPGVLDGLCGKIRLCAVPAEELLEIEFRMDLMKQGKIKYFGGKTEFMHRGFFDDVDIAFMVHTSANSFASTLGSVGIIAKNIVYKGKASHAGVSPHLGRNALYAATCGLNAVNAIRETLQEQDLIRIHPIITHGGDMVNAIPENVQLESYVRGKTFEGIVDANKKMNRALIGGAISLGTNIEIIDIPGYAPLKNDMNMIELCEEAAKEIGVTFTLNKVIGTGSTDMGDISQVIPAIHPYAAGSRGKSHGSDYEICDPVAACITNAKWQITMAYMLLSGGAERAKRIISEFEPSFESIRAFLDYQDSLNSSGDRIVYNADGTIEVK